MWGKLSRRRSNISLSIFVKWILPFWIFKEMRTLSFALKLPLNVMQFLFRICKLLHSRFHTPPRSLAEHIFNGYKWKKRALSFFSLTLFQWIHRIYRNATIFGMHFLMVFFVFIRERWFMFLWEKYQYFNGFVAFEVRFSYWVFIFNKFCALKIPGID